MDYFELYIKYKTKYTFLKNKQDGGSHDITDMTSFLNHVMKNPKNNLILLIGVSKYSTEFDDKKLTCDYAWTFETYDQPKTYEIQNTCQQINMDINKQQFFIGLDKYTSDIITNVKNFRYQKFKSIIFDHSTINFIDDNQFLQFIMFLFHILLEINGSIFYMPFIKLTIYSTEATLDFGPKVSKTEKIMKDHTRYFSHSAKINKHVNNPVFEKKFNISDIVANNLIFLNEKLPNNNIQLIKINDEPYPIIVNDPQEHYFRITKNTNMITKTNLFNLGLYNIGVSTYGSLTVPIHEFV